MYQPVRTARRLCGALILGLSLAVGPGGAAPAAHAQEASQADFGRFVQSLWPAAKARGVSRGTFDRAFQGVEPDPKIIALTRKQSEFVRPIWDYINGDISTQRQERGRQRAAERCKTLASVEQAFGVHRSVVLVVWCMANNFGNFTGTIGV